MDAYRHAESWEGSVGFVSQLERPFYHALVPTAFSWIEQGGIP